MNDALGASTPPALAWLLLPLALGCADKVSTDAADSGPTPPPATAMWMGELFADHPEVPLGRVLLPGAFNSSSYACAAEHGISPDSPEVVSAFWASDDDDNRERIVGWAKTQGRPIGQQLEDGIRFIEINVTVKDGVLTTWHSVYGVPVGELIEELVAFSLAFPEEVVLLNFGVGDEDWALLAEALAVPRADDTSLCELLYDGETPAALVTLGDAQERGRPIVWAPKDELRAYLEAEGCPTARGGVDRAWSITVSPEGVEEALAASVDSRDPERVLINDFVFSLSGSSSVLEQAGYISGYPGVQEASIELGFAGDFPARLIETYDAQGNMNVLAGAYYEDTELVEAAIAANRARWATE